MNERPDDERKHIFDDPRNVKRLLWVFYTCCLFLFAFDFIYHRHAATAWEAFFDFYAVYGFVACVLLVLIAKELRKVLMRREDYYDDRR